MSIFAEFQVPADELALHRTFQSQPDLVVEVERVVANDGWVTPYFWITDCAVGDFLAAAEQDPSIENTEKVDTYDEATLFRAEWTRDVESIFYAYTQTGAVILEATGSADSWDLQMRFDDRDGLRAFQSYCAEHDLSYDLVRLHELTEAKTGSQYGLTEKQQTALLEAREAGYYETPREATLAEVAEELDISQQALSHRLRRGHGALIEHTLTVSDGAAQAPEPR